VDKIDRALGTAPIVELLATIGKKMGEGSFKGGGSGDASDPANMTKEQAQAKIAQLNGDTEFQKKYHDRAHPEHQAAVDQMSKLFARA
jgi:hypothetical protein